MICKVLAEKLLCKGRVRGEDKEEGRERETASLKLSQGSQLEGAKTKGEWNGLRQRTQTKDLCCYFAPNDAQKFDIILIEVERST